MQLLPPQNLLVNANGHVLKLCDFGSAKVLTPGEPNISYICSRCAAPMRHCLLQQECRPRVLPELGSKVWHRV